MASRPKGYGMTAEIHRKIAQKYDPTLEVEAIQWIEAVVQEPIEQLNGWDGEALGDKNTKELLKDGILLCKLMNVLQPKSISKINESKMAFKQMENISKFLTAAEAYGCRRDDLFQTVDLYEGQNMVQVINGIHSLGRKARSNGFAGPVLGPKESVTNVRDFSDDVLKAGSTVIGLQAGSNKGASQAGMNIGKTRAILD